MTPNPHSKLRKEHWHRLVEHVQKAQDEVMWRLMTDTNPDPWPPMWTDGCGLDYDDNRAQHNERFDACRDRDGNLFPLLPHQLHRQKVASK